MNKKIIVFISILFTISLLSGIDSVAKTIKIKGDIELTRNQNIYNVSTGDQLFNDDELVCKENSYAAIKFSDDSSIVKLFPNSLLIIHSEKKGEKFEKRNFLKMGEVWTKVEKRSGLFEIETPTTVASVKGTGFLLSVDENGVTDLYTLEGEVEFSNKFDDQTASITAGNRGTSSGEGIINVQPFDISDLPANIREFIEEEIVEPSEPQGSQVVPPTPHSADIPEMEPEADEADNGDSPLSMGGGIGTVSDGENFYTQVRLMPELRFGKFGLGLDIELMIDQEGKVRKEDWDEWEDYVNKLYYLRYGNRGDKLYGQIGAIPSYTLGQGLIMKNYSNMLHYPNEKQIGLQLGGQIPIAEMQAEIFTSNITKNEILAGRLSLAPLSTSGIPFIEKMRFGATVAHDTNQINGLSDLDDDNYPDAFDDYPEDSNWHNEVDANIDYYIDIYEEINSDTTGFANWFENSNILSKNPSFDALTDSLGTKDVTIMGLDYELPLISNKVFALGHYAEVAKFLDTDSDKGAGFIFPGFYSKFLIFQMNLEYRQYQDEFIPGFFDKLYDDQRAIAYTSPNNSIITKFDRLEEFKKSQGWYGSITSNIFNMIHLTIAYEDMRSDDDASKALWGSLKFDEKIIPKLNRAEINYMQKDFDSISKLQLKGENAHIEGKVAYELSTSSELVLNYTVQFIDIDNNGKIEGEDETKTSMSMGVEFKF